MGRAGLDPDPSERHYGDDEGDLLVRSGSVLDVLGIFDLLVRFSHRCSPLFRDVGGPCRDCCMPRKWAERPPRFLLIQARGWVLR